MKENEMIYDVSAELEQEFGPKGSASRKVAEDKAWEEYNAQILLDARKNAGLTQQELAERIGVKQRIRVAPGARSHYSFCIYSLSHSSSHGPDR